MAHRVKATCLFVGLITACLPTHAPTSGVVPTFEHAALAYRVVTPSQREPTIIVLHGGPGATHQYLRPEWDRLGAAGRVVYYDQRGCGASTRRGPYSWQGHVRDLDAVVDRFAPRKGRVILAGSSWGSWLALLYTYTHPDRVQALLL